MSAFHTFTMEHWCHFGCFPMIKISSRHCTHTQENKCSSLISHKNQGLKWGRYKIPGRTRFFKLCKLKKIKEILVMEEAGSLSCCGVNTFDSNCEGAIASQPADSACWINPACKQPDILIKWCHSLQEPGLCSDLEVVVLPVYISQAILRILW